MFIRSHNKCLHTHIMHGRESAGGITNIKTTTNLILDQRTLSILSRYCSNYFGFTGVSLHISALLLPLTFFIVKIRRVSLRFRILQ